MSNPVPFDDLDASHTDRQWTESVKAEQRKRTEQVHEKQTHEKFSILTTEELRRWIFDRSGYTYPATLRGDLIDVAVGLLP